MTAEQLVHLITDNFAADEEVTFLYSPCSDDQGAVRLTDAEVTKHTQTNVNGHWEMKQIDLATHKEEWVKTDEETARKNALGYRFEVDGYTHDTKKVLEIL